MLSYVVMSIISVSRRTDIPAFYSRWFINRVRAGFCQVRNPFNANMISTIDLDPDSVDAFVFWSRNPLPLMKHLDELDSLGYSYYFLITLTGYPELVEPFVPPLAESLETFKTLSDKIGPQRVVWRFDPVIISDMTDTGHVVSRFKSLAAALEGYTKRVIFSFAHFYSKVSKRLTAFEAEHNIRFYDISDDVYKKIAVSQYLSSIAGDHHLEIMSCAEEFDLSSCGVKRGKCIDSELVQSLSGRSLDLRKDKSQRKECLCLQSRDIGVYGTCTHGCVYCYATNSRESALKRFLSHNAASPFLMN